MDVNKAGVYAKHLLLLFARFDFIMEGPRPIDIVLHRSPLILVHNDGEQHL